MNRSFLPLLALPLILTGCFDSSFDHNPKNSESVPKAEPTIDPQLLEQVAIKLPEGVASDQLPSFDLTLPSNAQIHQLANGNRFYGVIQNGEPQGVGQLYPVQQQNSVIIGQFANGRLIGTARFINPQIVYTGRINPQSYQPHGYGISIAKESRYQGFFNQGLMEGEGELRYTAGKFNGTTFKGEFLQGAPHQGELIIPNKGTYSGTIENGIFKGDVTYSDGRTETIEEKLL